VHPSASLDRGAAQPGGQVAAGFAGDADDRRALPDGIAGCYSVREIVPYLGLAHEKDLPILVTALKAQCPWLVTLNGKHFRPGHSGVAVVTPGEFLMQVRDILAHPGSRASWS
jgi:hypothetical protein